MMKRLLAPTYVTFIYCFFYLPILILVFYSFNDAHYSLIWRGFTTAWYQLLITDQDLWLSAIHSVFLGFCAATFATSIGAVTASSLFRYRFYGRKILHTSIFVLLLSPDIVLGTALLIMYTLANLPLGFFALLLSHIAFCLPFVVLTLFSRMKSLDKNIFEAARDLGATDTTIFFKIIIPLLWPAILSSWLLSFTLSLDDVVISYFVSGPEFEILPLKIYSLAKLGVKPEINALCSVMFVVTLIIVMTSQFILRKKN
ncbi:MAG: spermidine/putrescine ABC transporter permease PotC [Proteobacteria bacterium]|nr:spermidine/putrescine ABC transporter permease PotC [Pseudomonadota bacterium]